MADLSPEVVNLLTDELAAKIVILTGLPEITAREVAVSAIPPYDMDGDEILLRDSSGAVVARVRESKLDPFGMLKTIEA